MDEKLFLVQQSHNHQNDSVLARSLVALPGNAEKVFKTQKPALVMVWAAISEKGKLFLTLKESR